MPDQTSPLELTLEEFKPAQAGHYDVLVQLALQDALAKALKEAQVPLGLFWNGQLLPGGKPFNGEKKFNLKMNLPLGMDDYGEFSVKFTLPGQAPSVIAITIPSVDILASTFSDHVAHGSPVKDGQLLRVPPKDLTVEKSIFIEGGGELQMDAGAVLCFPPGTGIRCEGTLSVRGKNGKPVHFMAQDASGWYGIVLDGMQANKSAFDHCTFTGGKGHPVSLQGGFLRPVETGELRMGGGLLITNMDSQAGGRAVALNNVGFYDNNATRGGGLAVHNAAVQIAGSTFKGNRAELSGGGIFAQRANIAFGIGVIFEGNQSGKLGGAFSVVHGCNVTGNGPGFKDNRAVEKGGDGFNLGSTLTCPIGTHVDYFNAALKR